MSIIIILWLLIILLSILLSKLLTIDKNLYLTLATTLCIIIFLLNIQTSIVAAIKGLNLVIKTIFPTLFPFAVVCNLLISFDGISLYSKILGPLFCKPLKLPRDCSFPIIASIISGYPLGCKYACELYELGHIDKNQFERLLNIASNASPIFILGAVGATMLNNIFYGYLLLIANYVSPFIVGFLMRSKSTFNLSRNTKANTPSSTVNFGTALKNAIDNGLNITLNVGAFVILFSIIINIIKNNALIGIALNSIENLLFLPKNFLYGIFIGSIEFTNGCNLISTSFFSLNIKLALISFICSFSGLSVISQISSITSKYNVNMKKYVAFKFLQGLISFTITYFVSLCFIGFKVTSSISSMHLYNYTKLYTILYIFLIISLIITYFRYLIRRLHIL